MAGAADLGIVDADDYGLNETGGVTALVILPGLDGTAALHAQFVACLGDVLGPVTVLRYPPDKALDYAALEVLVKAALPSDVPFVLLGESFSGPIALSIAADPPVNLVGLVLSTTFARTPLPFFSPLAPLTRFAPVRALPLALLSWWLLGRWATRNFLSAEQVDAIAEMDNLETTYAKIAGAINGSLANTAGLFDAHASQLARLFAAYEEKLQGE